VVAYGRVAGEPTASTAPPAVGATAKSGSRAWSWAALMHRALAIDVLACPHCGGRLRLIHAARSRGDLEAPHAPGDGPLRAEPRSRPRPAPPRPDRFGPAAAVVPHREASFVLIRAVHLPLDAGGVRA